jgi:CheY-like chemotaxis protein
MARKDLCGRRILIVEDDFFIASDITAAFRAAGAQVVGPAATLRQALDLIARTDLLDGAVLDINLGGEMSFGLVDALRTRNIPAVFASGYDRCVIPPAYRALPLCEKPVNPLHCARILFEQKIPPS